ncbi:MAG: trk/ktr system potassium uptake protein [Bacteroidota bacterium]|nr:trk/ktr system potassium uptake protein [Bacteroidota bacterium]
MINKKFCVIGLGYFGMNLSLRLTEAGADVLAIDKDPARVEDLSDKVAYAVSCDSTDERVMRSLGVSDMDAVIVAIGEGFESSILTTAMLQQIGVKKIYNRVTSPTHERLLKLMNVEEMLLPEAEAAAHLANRIMIPGIIESFEISKRYGVFEIKAPKEFINKTIIEINLRQQYSLNLVTIKRMLKKGGMLTLGAKEEFEAVGVPTPDTEIREDDVLVLFGEEKNVKLLLES